MSVIDTKYDLPTNETKCVACGGPLHFPFLCWRDEGGGTDICICGRCCQRIKRGFIADLIHVTAAMDIRDLGYNDARLVSTTHSQLEAEGEKLKREIANVLLRKL
jgi:hypothetical protein